MNLNEWAVRHGISVQALNELKTFFSPGPVNATPVKGGEAAVQKKIRLETNLTGGLLLRNNSGMALNKRGIPVRFGLGNDSSKLNARFKSSDLIGLTPLSIGGQTVGVFTAIETKHPGWRYSGTDRESGQLFFINVIKARGGIAGFATCPTDYINLISRFMA